MRVALAQLNYIIGNFDFNFQKITTAISRAKAEKADLIIFSELSVCGYPPHDLLEQKTFVDNCLSWVDKIAEHCTDIAAIIGGPSINTNPQGKILFNSAFFICDGKNQSIHHKALLPTYDIFDEYRYFEPGTDFNIVEYKDEKIAITICEDLWDDPPLETPFGRSRLYNVSPLLEMVKYAPSILVNIAASPFSYNKSVVKRDIFTAHAKIHKIPLFYINQVGAHTDLIFDGGSMVINNKGEVTDMLNLLEEDFKVYETGNLETKQIIEKTEIEKIHDALILGIRDYFSKSRLKAATLGLSGGIDSAVVLVLTAKALGPENVRVLLMPSQFSSDHSITDAVQLAQNLKVKYDIVKIQPSVNSVLETMKPLFEGKQEDITEENVQARIRGLFLMALSNKFGNILLNTSNKSEIAVGYGTLYGDMNGGLSVIGDVYKTDVYNLAHFMNKEKEIIPHNIIQKAPSAELRPDQKDSDSLPDYAVLDSILFQYIENQKSIEDIIEMSFDINLVKKVVGMVNFNEYKRFQTPPILRISTKAFGLGRKMPIVARY